MGFISRLVCGCGFWLVGIVYVAPKPSSQITVGFCFRSEFYFRNSISSRPFRARDLVTMAEVGSTRLTSLERVTTGVGSVSRGARAKPNSHDTALRSMLLDGADYMVSS